MAVLIRKSFAEMSSNMSSSSSDGRNGWNPLRVLNTSRPYTPLETTRDGRRRKGGRRRTGGGDLPKLVIQESREEEEEEEEGGGEDHPPKTGELRLPSIRGNCVVRRQFRFAPKKGEETDGDGDGGGDKRIGGTKSEEDLDPREECQQLLKLLLSRPESEEGEKEATESVIAAAERLLARHRRRNARLPRDCLLPLSKLLFLLANDDGNDERLLTSSASSGGGGSTLCGDFVDLALGRADAAEDAEAVLNSYGAIKLLSHNSELLEVLCSHGLVQLLLLHLKVLSQDWQGRLAKNVAFQATACLRNCLNSQRGQAEFRTAGGAGALDSVAEAFSSSKEISCNLARLYSVLSQLSTSSSEKTSSSSSSASSVGSLHRLTRSHPECSELVVRTAFALGNVAAGDDAGREDILGRADLLDCLTEVLESRVATSASTASEPTEDKLTEDIVVKVVRVFANLAVLPAGGRWAATNDRLVRCLVGVLSVGERKKKTSKEEEDDNYLLLSALSAVCNLSYYPIVRHCELYEGVVGHVFSADAGVAAEAARAVGNLSRVRAVRARIGERETLARLMEVTDRQGEAEAEGDQVIRDLR